MASFKARPMTRDTCVTLRPRTSVPTASATLRMARPARIGTRVHTRVGTGIRARVGTRIGASIGTSVRAGGAGVGTRIRTSIGTGAALGVAGITVGNWACATQCPGTRIIARPVAGAAGRAIWAGSGVYWKCG